MLSYSSAKRERAGDADDVVIISDQEPAAPESKKKPAVFAMPLMRRPPAVQVLAQVVPIVKDDNIKSFPPQTVRDSVILMNEQKQEKMKELERKRSAAASANNKHKRKESDENAVPEGAAAVEDEFKKKARKNKKQLEPSKKPLQEQAANKKPLQEQEQEQAVMTGRGGRVSKKPQYLASGEFE